MLPNFEFIKNRSFEISWAVFRCSALFKNEKLKAEIENSAIDLTVNYDRFNFKETGINQIAGQLPYIEKLIFIIKLAEAIGDINPINSKVLFRELNSLNDTVKKSVSEFSKKAEESSNINIESIFSKTPAVISNNENKENKTEKEAENTDKNIVKNNSAIKIGNDKNPQNNSAMVRFTANQERKDTASSNTINHMAIRQKVSSADDMDVQESWQELIYKKLREIGKASTKELTFYFPQISERTIRFYLQRLVENGLIERIGSTGPGSYYIHRSYNQVA